MKVLELITSRKVKEVGLPKGKISLYNSINELPISLFTDFQSYLIQDTGIGSSFADINSHFALLDSWISQGKIKEAQDERYNLHYQLFINLEKISISHISFGCLVHSVNGEAVKDYSEQGIMHLLKRLSSMGLTQGLVKGYLDEVKKNLIEN